MQDVLLFVSHTVCIAGCNESHGYILNSFTSHLPIPASQTWSHEYTVETIHQGFQPCPTAVIDLARLFRWSVSIGGRGSLEIPDEVSEYNKLVS